MIVADLSMTGLAHVYFNNAFLKILSRLSNSKLDVYAEYMHTKWLKEKLDDGKVVFHPFEMKSELGIRILLQDFKGCRLMIGLLRKSNRDESVFLLNRLPITLIVCNFLNLFLNRNIYNVMHGELEYLVNKKTKGLTKYYYKLFNIAYRLSTNKNTYVFLGESILKETLNANIKFKSSHLISIDHPYVYNAKVMYKKRDFFKMINIGMIGTAMIRKNSHYMAELANKITNKNAIVNIIGRAEPEVYDYLNKAKVGYFTAPVSGEEYEKMIDELDYSLCFYDNTINLALASGSFFDSIKFAKPILALKGNPYVDYYYNKLGNIGYRFSDLNEMACFINSLSNSERKIYELQVQNLIKAQEALSLENIIESFKGQLISNLN